jgi:glutamyl-tRNA reductase
MFMVDLGVPRDIEPRVSKIGDIYLYTIDDLRQVADEGLSKRQEAARQATAIIDSEVGEYQRWLHGARAGESLRQLRRSAMTSGQELAEKALRQIRSGGDPEAAIQQLSHGLTQRILHGPSTRLREAAEQQQEDILRAADWLFRGAKPQTRKKRSAAAEAPSKPELQTDAKQLPGEDPAAPVLQRSAGKQGT